MKISRREIGRILAASAAAATTIGTAEAQSEPDAVRAAREQFGRSAQQMAAVKIPIATEPPFHFKA